MAKDRMTPAEASNWWARRGDACDALAAAEHALLCANRLPGVTEGVTASVRDAIGAIKCAREMLNISTAQVQALAGPECSSCGHHPCMCDQQ